MLFAHHVEITFFGHHFEPEGIAQHMLAFGVTAVILFLAVYGGYTLVRKATARWTRSDDVVPRT